jgi:hypothetical protein
MFNRDNFDKKTADALGKRASFLCSNPDCRCQTTAPSDADATGFIYIGAAAHITAAAAGGPRYDAGLTSEQRSDISNGIFLCRNCADMIDKNNGLDFPVETLKKWKTMHEDWVGSNLNKSIQNSIVVVSGEHTAAGIGNVTGLHITKSAIIKPGTVVKASGIGNVTGTKIG